MTERLVEVGRGYGMELNVKKTKIMKISRQPLSTEYDRSKPTGECEIFPLSV